MIRTVLVVCGGDDLGAADLSRLPTADVVVAADSGIDRADRAGLPIDIAIGDFDSVTEAGLSRAEAAGVDIRRHPIDKNETDLELALVAANDLSPERIVVVALAGGRLDHFLANVLLLADDRLASVDVDALIDGARLSIVRGQRTLTGEPGDTLTLLPLGGPAHDVTVHGVQFELEAESLLPSSPRGVSNVLTANEADITVGRGVVLAIQPDSRW